jgi:AcrR family transcriptional regulator
MCFHKKLPRRERERIKRQNDILRAAKWIFAREGFEGTNLDKVAARCELAKGTIYYYFGSKNQLFSQVLEACLDEIAQKVDEAILIKETRASIKYIVEEFLNIFKRDYALFMIFFRERRRFEVGAGSLLERRVHEKFKLVVSKIEDIFRNGEEADKIKDYNPTTLAYLILGLIHIFALKFEIAPKEGAEMLTSILFEGLKK